MTRRFKNPARPIHLGLLSGTVLSVLVGVGVAGAGPKDGEIMPVSDITPGMKGYGLTVMKGMKPEKFDVEIISVLHNFHPDQDLILVKTPNNPRLDAAKNVAGMSGSPIYINDKMIGAYAYGWTFGVEPVAGVTPIQYMLDDMKRPVPPLFMPRASIVPKGKVSSASDGPVKRSEGGDFAPPVQAASTTNFQNPFQYDFDTAASTLATRFATDRGSGASLEPAETPIMLSGMSPSAITFAQRSLVPMGLEPMAGGGAGGKPDPNATTEFEDGGCVAVELLRGDVSAMGLGTTTHVSGDKSVAFGHPMMGGGASDLPTALCKVDWILASVNRSFKIGEPVTSMGTLVNDRRTSIVVDSKRVASSFPIHVEIEGVPGAEKTKWDSIASHDPFMAPMFTAMAIGSAIENTTAERGEVTWKAHTTVKIAGYGTLSLDDFGSGSGEPLGNDQFARSHVTRAIGALLNNPWEQVRIEGVETKVKVTFKRQVSMIRGTEVVEQELDPGAPLHVRVTLVPFLGDPETKVIEIPIPKEYEGSDVDVDLVPGYEVERPRAAPENVADLMAQLSDPTYDPDSLVAVIKLPNESGAAFRGNVALRLPPGAAESLRTSSTSIGPDAFGSFQQTAFPMQRYVVGRDRVHVKVRRNLK